MSSNTEKLQESLELFRQGMGLMIEAAPPLLQQQVKAEVTMASIEMFMGETRRRLAALEEREKERDARLAVLETNLSKALISLFPRVESVLRQLEKKKQKSEQAGTREVVNEKNPVASTSKEVPICSKASSCGPEDGMKKKQHELKKCTISTPSPSRTGSPSTLSTDNDDPMDRELIRAANCGNLSRIRSLITAGVNINAKSLLGKSALSIAALNGHLECLEELVNAGADKMATDAQGYNALHLAASRGKNTVVQYLLTKNLGVDIESNDGETALTLACKNGHEDCVAVLLEYFAEIDPKDCDNRTPLHHAVIANSVECVTTLLEWGADLYTLDKDGKSPMHYAFQSENRTMHDAILSITDSGND